MEIETLATEIKTWGTEIGFQQVGITGIDLSEDEGHLLDWLNKGMHGEMAYMERHGNKRSRPELLRPGTIRVISARMDYLPPKAKSAEAVLHDKEQAFISRYALGRDYHKVMRTRLKRLAQRIEAAVGPFGYRVFTDSAPVLEKSAGAQRRTGLDRETQQPAAPGSRLLVFHRGNLYRPAVADRLGVCRRTLRRLHSLYRHLPHPRHCCAVPGRCPALHILPDH